MVQMPSVVQELSSSHHFYGHCWLTLTFEPVTLSTSSASSCGCVTEYYCDEFY